MAPSYAKNEATLKLGFHKPLCYICRACKLALLIQLSPAAAEQFYYSVVALSCPLFFPLYSSHIHFISKCQSVKCCLMLVVNFPVTVFTVTVFIIRTLLAPSFQSHRKSIAQVCVWGEGGGGQTFYCKSFASPAPSLPASSGSYIRLSFYRWKFPWSLRACLLSIMISLTPRP